MAEMTMHQMAARIKELEAAATKAKAPATLTFKIGVKGGVSVIGLQRFPQTLYYEQWNRLLDAGDELRAFLELHKSELKMKGDAPRVVAAATTITAPNGAQVIA
jgi:hypothetical protein